MDLIQKELLEEIAGLHEVPAGAYNIRANGKAAARNTTANIDIVSKEEKPGIDIIIKPGTKKESVHIPVVISQTGLNDLVYNDFHIGEDCDVFITAVTGFLSMTVFMNFLLERIQKSVTLRSITDRVTARAER